MSSAADGLGRWLDATVLDLGRQLRWSYLPPLMVYLSTHKASQVRKRYNESAYP